MVTRPVSQRPVSPPSGWFMQICILFLVTGVGGVFLLAGPTWKLLAARSWTETRCTILYDRIPGSVGPTGRVNIRYTYVAGGGEHESDRYDFWPGSSGGSGGRSAIADRFPPGAKVPCWFDPGDPSRAVLFRDVSPVWLIGLLPLAALGIGIAMLAWARARQFKLEDIPPLPPGSSPFGVALPADVSRPAELRPAFTPLSPLLGITFLALGWNGFILCFFWRVFVGWWHGRPDVMSTVFLVPALVMGAFLIVVAGRQLLVLFNPRPHITLIPGVLATGGTARLEWRLGSGGRGVRRITITLEGREEARSKSGMDDEANHLAPFLSIAVVDCSRPSEIAGGSTAFTVPGDTIPSFRSARNKIVWSLKVHCDLPYWPDSDEEFEVAMTPGGKA